MLRSLTLLRFNSTWLFDLCRGIDDRPVIDKGPPSTIGFAVSFFDHFAHRCASHATSAGCASLPGTPSYCAVNLELTGFAIVSQYSRGVRGRVDQGRGNGTARERYSQRLPITHLMLSPQTKRLAEDEEMYQRVCRTLVLSFRFEGKTVTRSIPMPARGETRALDIASAAMAVLALHARKDR